jgi:hypothetical protein
MVDVSTKEEAIEKKSVLLIRIAKYKDRNETHYTSY